MLDGNGVKAMPGSITAPNSSISIIEKNIIKVAKCDQKHQKNTSSDRKKMVH